ncbi:hypothetical protein L1987_57252 [Smallanthus sonchifolius]|uniref:Uncharacterized protein n=1 Tax=Smallanthus sonchifolius TaxID=185202 RepID=A0ACB9DD34_9ASTR|nr:hypothetical protein L1987_57252 [Smallanthus sonchifolius]
MEVAKEVTSELQAKPDLIIGNYGEGNLVASLLGHKLGGDLAYVHCSIAHALVKAKYPNPDIYQNNFDEQKFVSNLSQKDKRFNSRN